MCLGMVSSSSSTCEIRRVAVRQHKHNLIWKSCWTPAYVNRYNINKTFQCHIRFFYSINAYLHKLVVYCSSVQWIREHQLDILTMRVLTIDIHHHTGNELCRCSCMLYDQVTILCYILHIHLDMQPLFHSMKKDNVIIEFVIIAEHV